MYNSKDFDNLIWNPLKVKSKVRDKWRVFGAYKEFKYPLGSLNEDLFFNYMALVYHKDSVLVKDFDSIEDRKHKALQLLDVESKEDGKYKSPIQKMLDHKNEAADKMIIRFCSLLNDQRYTLFVTLGMAYDKLMKRIYDSQADGANDIDDSIKELGKFTKEADIILKQLDELKNVIFVKDEVIANKADEEVLSYQRIPGYVELIAHKIIEV